MILNIRPFQYHADFQHALEGVGVKVVSCPVIYVHELPWSERIVRDVEALIVTSQIAVGILAQKITERHHRVYAVGPGTASAARAAGFLDTVDGGGTAEQLLHVLDAASFETAVYVSARNVSCDLAKDRPDRIIRQVVYDMVPAQTLSEAAVETISSSSHFIVPFYSPRSLEVFEALVKAQGLEGELSNATAVVIHPRLLDVMRLSWDRRLIAHAPNGAGMIHAIKGNVMHAIEFGKTSAMPDAA